MICNLIKARVRLVIINCCLLPLCAAFIEEICYENVECFDALDAFGALVLPHPPFKIGTSFRVFNKPDAINYQKINLQNPNSFKIVPKKSELVFIIHGWVVDSDNRMYKELRQALFTKYQTVIAVDWRKGATIESYPQSAANTAVVGRETAQLIKQLIDARDIRPEKVYLIGFSLGAHVSGHAGRWFEQKFGQKIGRITALDSAGPLLDRSEYALKSGDATFVDAIHTNGGKLQDLVTGHLGYLESFADVDFFPNGGQRQPHCSKGKQDITCNHHSAIFYYILSLTTCSYEATLCSSWTNYTKQGCSTNPTARMGYYAPLAKTPGTYFLETSEDPPYCGAQSKTQSTGQNSSTSWSLIGLPWVISLPDAEIVVSFQDGFDPNVFFDRNHSITYPTSFVTNISINLS